MVFPDIVYVDELVFGLFFIFVLFIALKKLFGQLSKILGENLLYHD